MKRSCRLFGTKGNENPAKEDFQVKEKVAVVSLGCSKNLVDSEFITGILNDAGYNLTDSLKDAQTIIVNTCGFIKEAKEESVDTILSLARYKKDGFCRRLIVAGCLPQRYSGELAREMPEVDCFVGTGHIADIPGIIKGSINKRIIVGSPGTLYNKGTLKSAPLSNGSAYIKIAEGCSNRCSYCAIPIIRGNFRSRDEGLIIREAIDLSEKGVKEINLIAQDTTSYGRDRGDTSLTGLLKKLAAIDGIEWIRLLYLHPLRIDSELLKLIAREEKICKYIDIPFQHVNGAILKAMNRAMEREEILRLIDTIRETVLKPVLRTTFIVGFPGEDEGAFEELIEFVDKVKFDHIGAFKYSPEDGTPAYAMKGRVSDAVKDERYKRLMDIQADISLAKNKALIGSIKKAIIERADKENPYVLKARIEGQAPDGVDGVTYITKGETSAGSMVDVKITDAEYYDLIGEII